MIRRATEVDAPSITRFLIDRFHGTYDHFAPVDLVKTYSWVMHHLKTGVVFVAEKDGVLIGTISGSVTEYWWSKSRHVCDGWYFVDPNARASRAGALLLKSLDEWAGDLDLTIGVISGDDLDRKRKFFERNGFECLGGTFHKRRS